MADRPVELELFERLRASTDSNHFYASRVWRQLVELGAGDQHARILLDESTNITLYDMPALTRDLRALGAQWSEVELLDPANLDPVTRAIQDRYTKLHPKLHTLSTRQDEIIAELVSLLRDARRG